MKRKKLIILPKLNNCNGNMNKQWFIYFSLRNPKTNEMVRVKLYKGLHNVFPISERNNAAKKIINEYKSKLLNGWNPYSDDSQVVYNDNLQYSNIAKKQSIIRKGNKTFDYYMSKYLQERKQSIANSTYQTYQSKFRIFSAYLKKKKLLSKTMFSYGPLHNFNSIALSDLLN